MKHAREGKVALPQWIFGRNERNDWAPAWRLIADMFDWTVMRAARLQDALERLTAAIRDVESELAGNESRTRPLASHIFVSRRSYRNVNETKSGKCHEMIARLSFNTACELGFRGSLDEWERLIGAVARRWTIWCVSITLREGKLGQQSDGWRTL
jgi:hypothetical protein